MIITVFGATGQVGKHIVSQALAKNFIVKAFGRNIEALPYKDTLTSSLVTMKGYIFDEQEVYNAIKKSDAVISALGGSFDGSDKARSLGIKNIITQMEKAGVKRIIAVGGLGVLNANDTTMIMDTPNYPVMYLPVGLEHKKAFEYLNQSSLNWTFVCAPDIVDEDANEKYITAANYPPTPNYYKVFAGNLASFILKEVTENNYLKTRVGISNTI